MRASCQKSSFRPTLVAVGIFSTVLAIFAPPAVSAYVEFSLASGGAATAKVKLRTSSAQAVFAKSYALLTMRDPGCPTTSSLQLSATGQGAGTISLPCQNWSFTGKGYRYNDPLGLSGGITQIVWKSRKLKIKWKGPSFQPLPSPLQDLRVRLTVGSESYCGRFQVFDVNNPGAVVSSHASACPALPTPTKTPTLTPTPTPTGGVIMLPTGGIFPTATAAPVLSILPQTGTAIDPDTQGFVTASGVVFNSPSGSKVFMNPGPGGPGTGVLAWEHGVSPSPLLFDSVVLLDPDRIFNPLEAVLTDAAENFLVRDREVVLFAKTLATGGFSPSSLGLRLNESGLHKLEPQIQEDFETFVPDLLQEGDKITQLDGHDVLASGPLSFSSVGVDLDAAPSGLRLEARLHDLHILATVEGISCDLIIDTSQLKVVAYFDLSPAQPPQAPTAVHVTMLSFPAVTAKLSTTSWQVSGACASQVPPLSDVIPVLEDAIAGFLSAGTPNPIAQKIEEGLAEVTPASDFGGVFNTQLDAPMNYIGSDYVGFTVNADARFSALWMPPGAPSLPAVVRLPDSPFPTFGATAPESGKAYDIAASIHATAFNQLLSAQTENGLLLTTITTLPDDAHPGNNSVLTAGRLNTKIGVPGAFPIPDVRPLYVSVTPTLAPIIDEHPGPHGELMRLQISQLRIEVIECRPSLGAYPWVAGNCDPSDTFVHQLDTVVDITVGMDLSVSCATGKLSVTLGPVGAGDVRAYALLNRTHLADSDVSAIMPLIVSELVPSLADTLGSFDLPTFKDFKTCAVEVSRQGNYLSLFMSMEPGPGCPVTTTCKP